MNREEYKRQNEQRAASRNERLAQEAKTEILRQESEVRAALDAAYRTSLRYKFRFLKWRPGWWNTPADRFGFFVAAFTGALFVVAYFQLGAMRHTDEAINEQLAEVRIQNETTREQMRANMAPVGIDLSSIVEKGSVIGWNVSPQWKNTGSTNAIAYRNWFDIAFVEGKNKIWTAADCPKLSDPGPLMHLSTIQPGGVLAQMAKYLKMSDALRAQQQQGAIFFVGHLEYRDVFLGNRLHHHDWCEFVIPNNIATNQFSFVDYSQNTD